jgi:hypothetical protein
MANALGFQCSKCGEYHDELPLVFGAAAPYPWFLLPEEERSSRAALSSDQCVIDSEYFYLLGRLELPVFGGSQPFTWLTWVSVSEKDFDRANDLWHTAGREFEAPCNALVQSDLRYPVSTLNLEAKLVSQLVGVRPLVILLPSSHPLYQEQRDGISIPRLQQIVTLILHGD